jgi:hypothetical protein
MTAPDERSQRLLIENAMGVCLRASWEVSYGNVEGHANLSFTIAKGRMPTPSREALQHLSCPAL